jgi:hypothetical protein
MSPSNGPTLPVLFPNPSDGKEAVQLQVNVKGSGATVKAQIFTTGFRKVNEVVWMNVTAGIHPLPLSITDQWGNPLANGLYYVVVSVGSDKTVLKWLVIK